jgi:hypothetical protein
VQVSFFSPAGALKTQNLKKPEKNSKPEKILKETHLQNPIGTRT